MTLAPWRCHETREDQHEEFMGCRCDLDAPRNMKFLMPSPLPDGLVGKRSDWNTRTLRAREQEAAIRKRPKAGPGVVGQLLRGGIVLAFTLGAAAFMLFAFVPVVTGTLALILVALSPVMLWAMCLFATLDVDSNTARMEAEQRHAQWLPGLQRSTGVRT